jgi:guanylate kinase
MSNCDKPRLIIISGPSGAGKSTVVASLLEKCELPLQASVSATTREPRDAEIEGKHYFFLSDERFAELKSQDAFLECKEVFGRGHWYGTLREQVAAGLDSGKWVILEIDVQGALAILEKEELNPITVFIHPGNMDELEKRLRARGTETEEAITRRLETAGKEMRYLHRYQYEIINGNVDTAVAEICQLLNDQKEINPCSKS